MRKARGYRDGRLIGVRSPGICLNERASTGGILYRELTRPLPELDQVFERVAGLSRKRGVRRWRILAQVESKIHKPDPDGEAGESDGSAAQIRTDRLTQDAGGRDRSLKTEGRWQNRITSKIKTLYQNECVEPPLLHPMEEGRGEEARFSPKPLSLTLSPRCAAWRGNPFRIILIQGLRQTARRAATIKAEKRSRSSQRERPHRGRWAGNVTYGRGELANTP